MIKTSQENVEKEEFVEKFQEHQQDQECVYQRATKTYLFNGVTIASASTMEKDFPVKASNIEAGKEIGKLIAKRAKVVKIEEVVFDRSGHLYHGVVKQIADSAREEGLKF